MKTVIVEGKRYPVIENMGFQHGRGCTAVEAQTPDGPRIATKGSLIGSKWQWAGPAPVLPRGPIAGQ
jgi:hypothetical protein